MPYGEHGVEGDDEQRRHHHVEAVGGHARVPVHAPSVEPPDGSRWSRRNAGPHTCAPKSPPVGVVSSNTRSRDDDSGLKWTTFIMIAVVTASEKTVNTTCTIRRVGQSEVAHSVGRRKIRRTVRRTRSGPTGAVARRHRWPGRGRCQVDVRSDVDVGLAAGGQVAFELPIEPVGEAVGTSGSPLPSGCVADSATGSGSGSGADGSRVAASVRSLMARQSCQGIENATVTASTSCSRHRLPMTSEQTGRVEGGVGDDRHAEPAGRDRADPEHESRDEQPRDTRPGGSG